MTNSTLLPPMMWLPGLLDAIGTGPLLLEEIIGTRPFTNFDEITRPPTTTLLAEELCDQARLDLCDVVEVHNHVYKVTFERSSPCPISRCSVTPHAARSTSIDRYDFSHNPMSDLELNSKSDHSELSAFHNPRYPNVKGAVQSSSLGSLEDTLKKSKVTLCTTGFKHHVLMLCQKHVLKLVLSHFNPLLLRPKVRRNLVVFGARYALCCWKRTCPYLFKPASKTSHSCPDTRTNGRQATWCARISRTQH